MVVILQRGSGAGSLNVCGMVGGPHQSPPPPESPPPRSSPGVSYPHKSCADCSCISGGLRPPNTPCFPGRTPSSPDPSGRGTTPYVPLDPLAGPVPTADGLQGSTAGAVRTPSWHCPTNRSLAPERPSRVLPLQGEVPAKPAEGAPHSPPMPGHPTGTTQSFPFRGLLPRKRPQRPRLRAAPG